jgi:hypothetical protein
MVYLRGAVVLPAILFCALQAGAFAPRAQDKALEKDAAVILDQVRETHRKLSAYRLTGFAT